MKIKHILPFLMVLFLFSCKKNEADSKTDSGATPESTATAIDSAGTTDSQDTLAANDSVENKKLLLDFYKRNEKKAQRFSLSNTKDTTIVCAEKTRIRVSAGCFVSSKTGKAIIGKVQVSVTEYYKISDILLAKLSTTTNGKLLETGGMINITASSNGEKCELKKGKTIEIEMPRKQQKEGMQLYTGNWNNNVVNWELQKNAVDLNQAFTKVDQKPDYPGGIQKFYQYLSKNIYTDDDITTTIVAAFTVDREGNAINPRIIRGGSSNFINTQIVNAIKKAQKFTPGKVNGVAVNTYYTVPINIVGNEIEADSKKEFQKSFEKNYDDSIQTAVIGDINYYLFSSSTLGYINCDRLWKTNDAPRIDYAVNFEKNTEAVTTVIFHRVKSMMSGFAADNSISFNNIPSGEKITVVAIKYFDNKPYLAVKETETSAKGENNLVFEPVTLERLKSEMKKLDRFN
jgi:predicted protein tyrosine phosphatase